ncbi:hypothetical protein HJC22_23170 [Corallococcus exiguus]|uniref:hypothetical protein n=1 Tax=Corallococcus exiguus TaxID=83462 RepID=UPI001470E19F|nr:hypothetical protein [Corallococcus exiguus]NNC18618.1 hypothetical protein [Corallococcus exiguus]
MHATPDALDAVMKNWEADGELMPHKHYAQLAAFVRICDALEPHLSPSALAPRLAEWIAAIEGARGWLAEWTTIGKVFQPLNASPLFSAAGIARNAWRGPQIGPVRLLTFIVDPRLRRIAERDYATLQEALRLRTPKVALVFAGCVVEAILVDLLEVGKNRIATLDIKKVSKSLASKIDSGRKSIAAPSEWELADMIAVCGPAGLGILDATNVHAASLSRVERNLVHPNVERQETAELSYSDAMLAAGFAEKVIEAVQSFHAQP